MDVHGIRVIQWRRPGRLRRVCRWLPSRGELRLIVERLGVWMRFRWLPRRGYWLVAAGVRGDLRDQSLLPEQHDPEDDVKRRNQVPDGDLPVPALSGTSVILAKLPMLREFMSATQYEDMSSRTPGYMTLRNRGYSYEVTLYDPDSGCRIAVRAQELDKVLLLAETVVSAPESPWERDTYLTEQLAKKRKKK